MLVIADSGSTKTDWIILRKEKEVLRYTTAGINPYLLDESQIVRIIDCEEVSEYSNEVMEVHFYGSGCAREDKQELVKGQLREVFPLAEITVYSDILGAARGICGYNSGIVCILGTGSNACEYDGVKVINQSSSLGYILGDEGSGTFIGKRVLQDYLYKKLPPTILEKFEEKYKLTQEEILDNIYTKYMPNRYMASFSIFAKENIENPYIYGLLYECFYSFIDTHVLPIKNADSLKVNFVGSVSAGYELVLKEVCIDNGLATGNFVKSPLGGLIAYHLHKK